MADKKRLKRLAAQSITHLSTAVGCLIQLREVFAEPHPEYAKGFTVAIDGIGVIIETLVSIFTFAWGYFPDDINQWMH